MSSSANAFFIAPELKHQTELAAPLFQEHAQGGLHLFDALMANASSLPGTFVVRSRTVHFPTPECESLSNMASLLIQNRLHVALHLRRISNADAVASGILKPSQVELALERLAVRLLDYAYVFAVEDVQSFETMLNVFLEALEEGLPISVFGATAHKERVLEAFKLLRCEVLGLLLSQALDLRLP